MSTVIWCSVVAALHQNSGERGAVLQCFTIVFMCSVFKARLDRALSNLV